MPPSLSTPAALPLPFPLDHCRFFGGSSLSHLYTNERLRNEFAPQPATTPATALRPLLCLPRPVKCRRRQIHFYVLFFCCFYCNNIDSNCRLLLLLLLLHVQVSCCLCNSSSSSGLWSVEEGSRGKGAMAIGSCGLVVSKKGRAHSL